MTDNKSPSRYFKRKHYIAIGEAVRDHVLQSPIEAQDYLLPMVQAMCSVFKREYPAFDEQRFLKLCALID